MKGLIALVGAGEYLPVMNEVDRYLLAHCGADGRAARVVCLPTAAGQEGETSWQRWNRMGEEHFRALGAEVHALPIIDRASADEDQHLAVIENADLIYFSGGDPGYLYKTMLGSKAWAAAEKAWERGAVYAGCSAGAMILGTHMPDIRTAGFRRLAAFGVVTAHIILPHFDRMPVWAPMMLPVLRGRLKADEFAIGIDEDTALIGKPGADWHVQGRLKVHIISKKEVLSYAHGEAVPLP
jgi:cyanophycinase